MVFVSEKAPITLVGAGQGTAHDLTQALGFGPGCIAVDGGAALALKAGVMPDKVIGDFDSISQATLAQIPSDRWCKVDEQDSTDFGKALQRVSAPLLLGVGFLGGRVDHQLAVMHVLMAFPHKPCVLIAQDELIFLAPPNISLPCHPGDTVSLFPLQPVTGRSTGLNWPIDGLSFAPGYQSGTSNRALGDVTVQMDGPGMLMIVPRRLIRPVVEAFLRPDAVRWNARE